MAQQPDAIFFNGKITTLDRMKPEVSALALSPFDITTNLKRGQ